MNIIVQPGPGAPPSHTSSTNLSTRWTELRNTCEVVLDLACTITDSVDVHFLNHSEALKESEMLISSTKDFLQSLMDIQFH